MKAVVCVKIVNGELNPFDACALECALQTADDVTIISMCPESAKEPLSRLTRLGVKVILLTDNAFAGSDTLATSRILSSAVNKLSYDIIFCGRQTIDGDTGQVGSCLATLLEIPVITNVLKFQIENDRVTAKTRLGEESAKLPVLLTVERINDLRFPSIRSKLMPVTVWDNSILKIDKSHIGLSGSPTKVLKTFESKKGERKCKFINKEDLDDLVKKLMEGSAKENFVTGSQHKLKEVYAVGHEVEKQAFAIAEKVNFIDETDPFKVAQTVKKANAQVVLWNADILGRRNAPVMQALLKTGLCADCTALETDGETLYMYRPAMSGNVIAKIICRTQPVIATVRTVSESSDIIVSGGKGTAFNFDLLKKLAEKFNAQICASRGLVDMGSAPYEMQVGLTGKNVSPKIYIAVGISGAVQHTCAIENAAYVIAINPDKNARIFEYSDYGIISTLENF
ncbi:MAG: FAD-binding protein [Bacillota bacterium]|nr:FAD-binding protein [Bacillota bacterium]